MPGQLTAWRSILFQTTSPAEPSITHGNEHRSSLVSILSRCFMVRRDDHIIRTKTRFGRCDTLAARRLHNICIPSDSFAEGAAGGGVTNRGDTATQSVRGGEKKKNLIYSVPQRSGWRTRSKHLSDKSALGRWQSTYELHLLSAALPVKWLNCAVAEKDVGHTGKRPKFTFPLYIPSPSNIKYVRKWYGWTHQLESDGEATWQHTSP